MEFLGVGAPELLVILIVMLLVVGPQRLPEMAAQLARFLRTVRRYTDRVSREFNETMHEMEREYDEMRGEWKDVGQGLDQGARAVTKELESAATEASKGLDDESAKPASRSV
jgi:sec-independent protein translocase protein TatB